MSPGAERAVRDFLLEHPQAGREDLLALLRARPELYVSVKTFDRWTNEQGWRGMPRPLRALGRDAIVKGLSAGDAPLTQQELDYLRLRLGVDGEALTQVDAGKRLGLKDHNAARYLERVATERLMKHLLGEPQTGKPRLDVPTERAIREILHRKPSATREEVREHLLTTLGVAVPVATLSSWLSKMGAPRRPRKPLYGLDSAQLAAALDRAGENAPLTEDQLTALRGLWGLEGERVRATGLAEELGIGRMSVYDLARRGLGRLVKAGFLDEGVVQERFTKSKRRFKSALEDLDEERISALVEEAERAGRLTKDAYGAVQLAVLKEKYGPGDGGEADRRPLKEIGADLGVSYGVALRAKTNALWKLGADLGLVDNTPGGIGAEGESAEIVASLEREIGSRIVGCAERLADILPYTVGYLSARERRLLEARGHIGGPVQKFSDIAAALGGDAVSVSRIENRALDKVARAREASRGLLDAHVRVVAALPEESKPLYGTNRYRLYPTKEQERVLLTYLQRSRELYNAAVEERRRVYEEERRSVSLKEQRYGPESLKLRMKRQQSFQDVPNDILDDSLRRVDRAFRRFFSRLAAGEKPGYPRFKGEGGYKSVTVTRSRGFSLKWDGGSRHGRLLIGNNRRQISQLGAVRIRMHRGLPEGAAPKTLNIKREASGRWYASVVWEIEEYRPPPHPHPGTEVGVHPGVVASLTEDNGREHRPPDYIERHNRRLKKRQRRHARKKKGSRRREKARKVMARSREKVRDARKDFQHKVARELVERYEKIYANKIDVKALVRNNRAKPLNERIMLSAWSTQLTTIVRKAEKAGGVVVEVDAILHPVQLCSRCDRPVPKDLSVREHKCAHCGLSVPRTVNAARNAKKRAAQALRGEDLKVLEEPRTRDLAGHAAGGARSDSTPIS